MVGKRLASSRQVVGKWLASGWQVVGKWLASGHQVVGKWSSSGQQVITVGHGLFQITIESFGTIEPISGRTGWDGMFISNTTSAKSTLRC